MSTRGQGASSSLSLPVGAAALDDNILSLVLSLPKPWEYQPSWYVIRGMTEFTPPPRYADPAKLPPMADPRSDRNEPGTVLAALREIRKILRDSERYRGEGAAQPNGGHSVIVRSAPTADDSRERGTVALSARTFTTLVAPPPRRSAAAHAVLVVAGLALFGAMSLIAMRGKDLDHPAASAPGKRASPAGDRSEAVARAAIPPARTVKAVTGGAARSPIAAPKHLAAAFGTAAPRWISPLPEPRTPTVAPVNPPARAAARHSGGGFAQPPIAVMRWGLRSGNREIASASEPLPAGWPLTLRIIFDGNLAAAEQIRSRGGIAIEVRWKRETSDATSSAPNLVTRLAIGNRRLADRLAAEARRTGSFVWHSWAEKRSLRPGTWDVSLTYPSGQPLACGHPPTPCRFHITVGQRRSPRVHHKNVMSYY